MSSLILKSSGLVRAPCTLNFGNALSICVTSSGDSTTWAASRFSFKWSTLVVPGIGTTKIRIRQLGASLSLLDNDPNCLAIGEVNHQALFKRVAAVVHHGGAGTTTAAAFAGAPQVVIPQIYDQHYWAQRIHHLGIGTPHASGTPTTDRCEARSSTPSNQQWLPGPSPSPPPCATTARTPPPAD